MFLFFNKINKKRLVIPAFFYVLFIASCDTSVQPDSLSITGPTMGTSYNVKVVMNDQTLPAEDIKSLVDAELARINQAMSTYISDSELSLFNQAPVGQIVNVSAELCRLVEQNHEISALSGGRYDITIGPLVNLWGFGPEKRSGKPSQEELNSALAKVGYQALSADCEVPMLEKAKAIYADLSASAKGYAAEQVARLLEEKGLRNAMVEIGGELFVLGKNASGGPWRIAVEKPSLGHTGAVQVIQVSNVAIATSGDYRNYYEIDGERVSHTIDPVTAKPINHTLASVTVVATSGAMADAWATALNVLGPDEGFDLASKQGVAAYFIIKNGDTFSVKHTDAFEQYLVES